MNAFLYFFRINECDEYFFQKTVFPIKYNYVTKLVQLFNICNVKF